MKEWLLDTVTVSELRKGKKMNPNVRYFFSTIDNHKCWLSVVSLTEIQTGIKRVKTKDAGFAAKLNDWYETQMLPEFSKRLCLIDQSVAEVAADFIATKGLSTHDAYLAATAANLDLALVTRKVRDFSKTGIEVINPWIKKK